jgi:hypothetical protein
MQTNGHTITNEFSVEVNLTGAAIDPARITEILGLQPTTSASTGEPRRSKPGDAPKVYTEGFWAYEVSSNDEVNECRDHQLNCVVDTLTPHCERLREAGVERIYFYFTLSSFLGLMNIHLQTETMSKLSAIGADLYISCFDCFDPSHAFWSEEDATADNTGSNPAGQESSSETT